MAKLFATVATWLQTTATVFTVRAAKCGVDFHRYRQYWHLFQYFGAIWKNSA